MKKRLKGLLAIVMAAAVLFSSASLTASAAQTISLYGRLNRWQWSDFQITYEDAYAGDTIDSEGSCGQLLKYYFVEEGKASDGEGTYYYYSERMNTADNGAQNTAFSSKNDAEQFASGASVTPDRRCFNDNFVLPANSDGYYKYKVAVFEIKTEASSANFPDGDIMYYFSEYETVEPLNLAVLLKEVPCSFTVTFDKNDGTGSMENYSGTYDPNGKLPKNQFTRDGYDFAGWNTKPDGTGTFYADEASYVPKENNETVTLYAQWIYTLTFDANGGTFEDGTDKSVKRLTAGADITAPAAPERQGFVFDGWLDNDGNPVTKLPEKMPAANKTYTAKWIATHKITYYIAKGGEAYETKTYAEGASMTHPEVGEISGIVYKGWVDGSGNAIPDVMGTSDIEAYAVVDYVKKYKATYVVDGKMYKEYEIPVGSAITVPDDPELDGFVFTGWTPAIPQYMPANALTFVATFEKAPEKNEYIATYKVDGKTHKSYVIKEGEAMQIPEDPEKFGYTFVGWEPEVPDTMPGYDVEFEAQWEVDKTFTTVVIGGTVIAGGVAAAVAGLNAAWITGVSIVGGVLVIAGTSALIKNTHTVTYTVNGEVYKTYKVVKGAKIPVPADPSKDGEQFKGWSPEVPEKMGDTDLTFEAVWESTEIPDTGSTAGITAFAVLSGAMAAAYVILRKKKED